MANKRTFTVATIGLSETELRMLKSLCLVSGSRARSYALAGGRDAVAADIRIIDAQNPQAMALAQELRAQSRAPTVVVAATDAQAGERYVLRRPLAASRLLRVLDDVLTNEFGYMPELVIGSAGAGAPTAAHASVTAAPAMAAVRRHHTALVVDDSPTIRKQIELALRLAGVEAVCAETAEAASEALSHSAYDLIFLDVVLPGDTDGYQICRAIKRSKSHRDTPVVMLTGRSSTFDRVRGSLAGCDTYLTKPVENETFRAVLKKYLRGADTAVAAGGGHLQRALVG